MAVDTAAKRQSALTFGLPFMRGLIPDGTLDQGDRQNAAFGYSAILAGEPVIIEALETYYFCLYAAAAPKFTLYGVAQPEYNLHIQLDEKYRL